MTQKNLFPTAGATISQCGKYRYHLWRDLDTNKKNTILWVMLNPSTANEFVDDPTIRRVLGFSKALGFNRIEVVNLFAYRATDPKELHEAKFEAIGYDNDTYIKESAQKAKSIMVAWGSFPDHYERRQAVLKLIDPKGTMCLGVNKDGNPKHPLYIKKTIEPIAFHGYT